ncbi:class I SAM-dependent methyltransferase [Kordiimonas lipolytica]|uniref:Class I SAM-dependent methyltransferase n=1 Tax=Kordiimonas lipolytica TaxID=1662421 RepID=A0ABV8U5V2_9PROT|nr:class I SAM-dependent methyltransferase [Kordiimonas lipolytica]
MSKTAEQEKGEPEGFVPALRYKWATGVYDLVIEYFTRGSVLRRLSVDAIAPEPGEAILDLGCGTGELSLAIAQTEPRSSVTGYDIDPEVLEIALNKMGLQSEVSAVTFRDVNVTDAASLPQQDIGRFDCVTSSLVFHHLTHDQKQRALKSVQALLRPGGRFVLIDWGPGANVFLRAAFWLVRLLDGLAVTRDNAKGNLPDMLEETSFSQIYAKPLLNTMFGTIWQYSANRCN